MEQGYNLELNKYPIFDESYREVLNKKIVDEYYFREIGVETPERFKHHLNHTMDMIMPYYNQLYESELLKIDPLLSFRETEQLERTTDVDRTETGKGSVTQDKTDNFNSTGGDTSSTNMTGTSVIDGSASATTIGTETTDEDTTNTKTENKLSVTSDTPGGMLSVGNLKTHTWASGATMDEGSTSDIGTNDKVIDKDETVTTKTDQSDTQSGTSNTINSREDQGSQTSKLTGSSNDTKSGTINTIDEYIKTKFGVAGHQSNLLKEYRATFLNIDKMIVSELSALFMGVY